VHRMPDKVALRLSTAFGPSREHATLLAFHPEEAHDQYGKPITTRRTIVLSLKGSSAVFREERPVPLVRSWYSAGSGVGYCTSLATTKLFKWQAGKWSDETFSDTPVKIVRFIFGLSGSTPEADQLFLVSADALFIRSSGIWKRHSLRGQAGPYQIHGRGPADIFIGGDPLLKWDGKALGEVGGPEDGEIITTVWVTPDDRLIGGTRSMYVTTADGEWQPLGVPEANYGNLMELDGVVFGSSDAGLVQVRPAQSGFVNLNKFVRLTSVGDALVAAGDAVSIIGDGKVWEEIQMPLCEVGKRPT
jgi:hypothetical protein